MRLPVLSNQADYGFLEFCDFELFTSLRISLSTSSTLVNPESRRVVSAANRYRKKSALSTFDFRLDFGPSTFNFPHLCGPELWTFSDDLNDFAPTRYRDVPGDLSVKPTPNLRTKSPIPFSTSTHNMSAKPSITESRGESPGQTSGSPSAAGGNDTPNEVEMKSLRPDPPKGSIPLGEDVMQLARMGEIGAMQNLFTAKRFTANHRDEEGITPLHVRCRRNPRHRSSLTLYSRSSGPPSTINMRCANS